MNSHFERDYVYSPSCRYIAFIQPEFDDNDYYNITLKSCKIVFYELMMEEYTEHFYFKEVRVIEDAYTKFDMGRKIDNQDKYYYGISFDIRINDNMDIFYKTSRYQACIFEDISFADMLINELK